MLWVIRGDRGTDGQQDGRRGGQGAVRCDEIARGAAECRPIDTLIEYTHTSQVLEEVWEILERNMLCPGWDRCHHWPWLLPAHSMGATVARLGVLGCFVDVPRQPLKKRGIALPPNDSEAPMEMCVDANKSANSARSATRFPQGRQPSPGGISAISLPQATICVGKRGRNCQATRRHGNEAWESPKCWTSIASHIDAHVET